jgi:hypothetical protein
MEKVKQGLTSLPEAVGTARPDDTRSPMEGQKREAPAPAKAAAAPVTDATKKTSPPTKETPENSGNELASMLGLVDGDEKK